MATRAPSPQPPGAQLVAVFDTDRERADGVRRDSTAVWPSPTATRSSARDDVDLVMVALPNFLHEQATVAAASAGKHIFLEKPMADTLEECDRMLAAVERAGVHLLVAHSQRYFAVHRPRARARPGRLARSARLCHRHLVQAVRRRDRLPWFLDRATGGGMWLMNGAHMIDRTCWVLDTEVESVRAWIGSPFHHLPADDANMAFLKLAQRAARDDRARRLSAARGVEKCEVEVDVHRRHAALRLVLQSTRGRPRRRLRADRRRSGSSRLPKS